MFQCGCVSLQSPNIEDIVSINYTDTPLFAVTAERRSVMGGRESAVLLFASISSKSRDPVTVNVI